MMLASLFVRLGMVALTMTIVCWVGWTIPASRDAGSLHAQGPVGSGTPLVSVPSTVPEAPLTPPPQEQRAREPLRQAAPVALDVNRAKQEDLEQLPGIGPVLARRIVEYRESQGAFEDVEQLRQVKGIGKKTFERIRTFVVVNPPVVRRPARKHA